MTTLIRPAACIALAILTGAFIPGAAARAQEKAAPAAAPQPTADATGITVKGTGEVSVKPDMAYLTLTVQSQGRDTLEVARDNAVVSRRVIDAVKMVGIPDKDIALRFASGGGSGGFGGGFSGGGGGGLATGSAQEAQVNTYSTVRVTVPRLDNVSRVVEAAVKAGASGNVGLEFSVANLKEQRNAALKNAVEDGMGKAKAMADAARIPHIRLVAMTEAGAVSSPNFPYLSFDAANDKLTSGGTFGITASTLRATVTLRFEIVPEK